MMRKLLILVIFASFLSSCTFGDITKEGCEYWRVNYGLVHKGNCSNPVHQNYCCCEDGYSHYLEGMDDGYDMAKVLE